MQKLNPKLMGLLILTVAVAAWSMTGNHPTSPSVTVTKRTSQSSSGDETDLADLNVKFPRYKGKANDPFVPGVLTETQGGRSTWTLTGINSMNGQMSACLENASTGDSVFIAKGDKWNGFRVLQVLSDSIVLQNAYGQRSQMTFAPATKEVASILSKDKSAGRNGSSRLGGLLPGLFNSNFGGRNRRFGGGRMTGGGGFSGQNSGDQNSAGPGGGGPPDDGGGGPGGGGPGGGGFGGGPGGGGPN